jgi:hypothetical protein
MLAKIATNYDLFNFTGKWTLNLLYYCRTYLEHYKKFHVISKVYIIL